MLWTARPACRVLPAMIEASSLLELPWAAHFAWRATFSTSGSQHLEGWQHREAAGPASSSDSSGKDGSARHGTGIFPGHASAAFNQLYTQAPPHSDPSPQRQRRRTSSEDWADAVQDGSFEGGSGGSSGDGLARLAGMGTDGADAAAADAEAKASRQMADYMRRSSLGELRRRMLMHKSRMRPLHIASAHYCLQRLAQEQRTAAAAPSRHERGGLHGAAAAAVAAETLASAPRGPLTRTAASGSFSPPMPQRAGARRAPSRSSGDGPGSWHADAPQKDPHLLLVQQMLGELAGMVWQQLRDFNAEELATVLHAWARLGWHPDAQLLVSVRQAMLSPHVLARASAQDLSMALWALAKLEALDGASLEAAAPGIEALLHSFTPQGLTTTAWAMSQAHGTKRPPKALARQLAARFLELLTASSSEATGLGLNDRGSGSLGGANLGRSLNSWQQWQQCQPQQQQQQQQHEPQQHGGTGAVHAVGGINGSGAHIEPRDVSGMMHALARIGVYPAGDFRALCDWCSDAAATLPLRVLCTAVWAAAELRHWDERLMAAALDAAAAREAEMTPRDAVELCKAAAVFACVGGRDGGIGAAAIARLAAAVARIAPHMSMTDAATASWALLGVLGLRDNGSLLRALAGQVAAKWQTGGTPHHWDACMLFVTQLSLDASGSGAQLLPGGPGGAAFAACREAWCEDVQRALQRGGGSSGTWRAALALLRAAGVDSAQPRQLSDDELFIIDVLVPDFEGAGPVAIVENTETNLVRNVAQYGSVVTGATALRDRLLAARGYRVVPITKYELERMQPEDLLARLQGKCSSDSMVGSEGDGSSAGGGGQAPYAAAG